MSKRFSTYLSRSSVNKKPKLDISRVLNNCPGPSKQKTSPKNDDIWGDDDDDVILLASQAIETIDKCSTEIIAQQESFSAIFFENFENGEVKTSTQLVKPPSSKTITDFMQDDDDAFNNVEEYLQNEYTNGQTKTQPFVVPKSYIKPTVFAGTSKMNGISTNGDNGKEEKLNNKNHSNDIQVNYLKKKLDNLRKENEKLTRNVSDYTEKLQTKDGEVSMLRDELHHTKQKNDTLRLEKMQENDCVKQEWEDKFHDLEKNIISQQSQLEFKKLEIIQIKTKKLNETQRINNNNESIFERKRILKHLNSMNNLNLPIHRKYNKTINLSPEIFAKEITEDKNYNFRDILFHRELENLQSILAQIQVESKNDLNSRIFNSVKLSIIEFRNYVQELEFTKYRDTNSDVEYRFLCETRNEYKNCDIHKQEEKNIFQNCSIFPNEKACLIRRYIAVLSVIFQKYPNICEKILVEKIDDNQIIDLIIDGIEMIGYSTELYSHFGLIEAFAVLLNNIVQNIHANENLLNNLNRYIKYLIFSRPDNRLLKQIVIFFNYASTKCINNNFLNSFCTPNTTIRSLVTNEYYKIIQFSPDSAMLQVYGALLEIAFPQHIQLNQTQINLLYQICYNHMKFIRNSFEQQTNWIWKTKSDVESCDCYIKIVTSLVVLFHLILKQWVTRPKCIDIKKISLISKIGVLVLCNIFHINYRREVLQIAGSSIKYRLQIIYDWLKEYKVLFRFKLAHCNALQSVKLSHIIADPLKSSYDQISDQSTNDGDEIYSKIYDAFI